MGVWVGEGVGEAVAVWVGEGVGEGEAVWVTGIGTPLFQANLYLPLTFTRTQVNFLPAKTVVCPTFRHFAGGI